MSAKSCARCGAALPKGRRKYCSNDCADAAEAERAASQYTPLGPRPGVYRDNLICEACGTLYSGHICNKRCPTCRAEKKRRDNQAQKRRQAAGQTRRLGSTDLCAKCNQPYTVVGGNQRYCPDCAPIAVRKNINAHNAAWNREYYADPAHKARKTSARRIKTALTVTCAICGKSFNTSSYAVTCSPECRAIYRAQYLRTYDATRRKSSKPSNTDD